MSVFSDDACRAPLSSEISTAAATLALVARGRAAPTVLGGRLLGTSEDFSVEQEALSRRFLKLPLRSRSAVRDMAYKACRRLGLLQTLAALLNRTAPMPDLAALQWIALDQLMGEGAFDAIRPPWVVVDQAVAAAPNKKSAGFLNATLRRFLGERERLLTEAKRSDLGRLNFPLWWVNELRQQYPSEWPGLISASNVAASMTLRVHPKYDAKDYQKTLLRRGIQSRLVEWAPQALILEKSFPVNDLPFWQDGVVSVQDACAQLAARLLSPQTNDHVLDACAAPGGKAMHLLELADCHLTAADRSAKRLAYVRESLGRQGKKARLVAADVRSPAGWWDGTLYDRILVDAPCTGSGVVRRHPDIRWLRRPGDLLSLPRQQLEILLGLWPFLRNGGRLLFATCSVFQQEGEGICSEFQRMVSDAQRVAISQTETGARVLQAIRAGACLAIETQGGGLQCFPASSEGLQQDGFFYALWEKAS